MTASVLTVFIFLGEPPCTHFLLDWVDPGSGQTLTKIPRNQHETDPGTFWSTGEGKYTNHNNTWLPWEPNHFFFLSLAGQSTCCTFLQNMGVQLQKRLRGRNCIHKSSGRPHLNLPVFAELHNHTTGNFAADCRNSRSSDDTAEN